MTMHDAKNGDHLLPIGVNSLSDYTPNKLQLLLAFPVSMDITTLRKSSPPHPDASSKLPKRSSNRSNVIPKTRSSFRQATPITRPHSSLDQYEQHKSLPQRSSIKPTEHYDMRFFIIRHGERVDRYFGPNWYISAFDQHNQYRPYHQNLPPTLPSRSNNFFWTLDTPLTSSGLNAAKHLGRRLASKHFQPTSVYSSPAMRCILTTNQILKGLGLEKQIPIRIEPGLLEFGAAQFGMNIFFQPIDWFKFGLNIDLSYKPILTNIPAFENENAYYLRSKYVIREIEKHHHKSPTKVTDILIIAHATSPETLTWDLIGKQPNFQDLYRLSLNIAYLQLVITERKRDKQFWSVKSKRLV